MPFVYVSEVDGFFGLDEVRREELLSHGLVARHVLFTIAFIGSFHFPLGRHSDFAIPFPIGSPILKREGLSKEWKGFDISQIIFNDLNDVISFICCPPQQS